MSTILIAGGSGLIGQTLTTLLQKKGYQVRWLTRTVTKKEPVPSFRWEPALGLLDPGALDQCDAIVSLAGTPIASGKWTAAFKDEVIGSRLQAARTLIKALDEHPHQVKCLVSASAIGYYGSRGDEWLNENSDPGSGFLAETTLKWEKAYATSPVRSVKLRIGVVLSNNGGAMKELSHPLKFGVCPILGDGRQFMSWIHIEDVCRMIVHSIENENLDGVFNAVAPLPVRQSEFMQLLREIFQRTSIAIPAPSFMMKLILGEKSAIVLDSTRVSCRKIQESGFEFLYPNLQSALQQLHGQQT